MVVYILPFIPQLTMTLEYKFLVFVIEWVCSNPFLLGALLLIFLLLSASAAVYLIVHPAPVSNIGRKIDTIVRVVVSTCLFSCWPLSFLAALLGFLGLADKFVSVVFKFLALLLLTSPAWYPFLFVFIFRKIVSKAEQTTRPDIRKIVAQITIVIFAVVGEVSFFPLLYIGLLAPVSGGGNGYPSLRVPGLFVASLPVWSIILFVFLYKKISNGNDTPAPKIEAPATGKEDESLPFWKRMKVQQKKMPSVIELVLNKGREGLVSALNNKEININEPYPDNGNTPLHIAAWNGYTEIVQLLLTAPAIDKTLKNKSGQTALDLAKQNNHTEIVQLLQE